MISRLKFLATVALSPIALCFKKPKALGLDARYSPDVQLIMEHITICDYTDDPELAEKLVPYSRAK